MSFNTAQNHQIDLNLLEELESKPVKKWGSFLEEEFISAITKYNNSSTPGLDKVLWRYLKRCVKNAVCLKKFINIANTSIELGH